MGKNGALMRQNKRRGVTRTFTEEELLLHDMQVAKRALEIRDAENKKAEREMRSRVTALWNERAEMFQSGSRDDNMLAYMRVLMAIPCRVLIEQFGWKVPRTRGRNTKIMEFANAVAEEIERIREDERVDIVAYARETYDKYGVGFQTEERESHGDC